MVSSWISPKARKGLSSDIAGRGLFAIELIGAGEIVAVKGGHIVTTSQLDDLPDPLPNSEIQIADGLHLVAISPEEYEPVMLFINHSCEPNVGLAGNIVYVAMRDVAAGEELTIDYALFDDYEGQEILACHCKTASCRGVIGGHDWRRSELQRKYKGYFSWYLQRKITEMPSDADE
ncbi:MAG: SET domain-containing protein-lysine N-methyltransferase [Mycobacterium sp.]|uniref:SET domain-containing protein n=1 Tax=Mycobacterium sp. TaxID=1785 RepID=UPI003C76D4A1